MHRVRRDGGLEVRVCVDVPQLLAEDVQHHVRVVATGGVARDCVHDPAQLINIRRQGSVTASEGLRDLLSPIGVRERLLAHHRVRRERFAEDGAGELEHLRAVVVPTQRRRRRHWRNPPQRVRRVLAKKVLGLVLLQHQPEAAQQQRNVGALRAVVRVELVQHQVLQRCRGLAPNLPVFRAQEQLIQHLVVGKQDVRRVEAHLTRIID